MDKTILTINSDWRFHLGDEPDAWKKDYCDHTWRQVCLPHDWSVELPFSQEYSSGTGYVAGGIGWYRLHFYLPEEYRSKKIHILFDGIYKNSQVWCNSYYKGYHPCGYTGFSYDLSDELCFGKEENVICVRVDHREISDSRWFTGSGITRKVTLVIEESLRAAENGIFFSTAAADTTEAEITVKSRLINDSCSDIHFQLTHTLLAPDHTAAGILSSTYTLAAGQSEEFCQSGSIKNPVLWSPETPALYSLKTEIIPEGASEASAIDTFRVGIRTIRFDADHGFFLNHRSVKLKGVCVHHDAGALGAAVTKTIWERRLKKLKEMGCNAIRCSHNPHMPELYDLCDEMGFLVMDEAFDEWEAPKNKWSSGHNVYPPKHEGYYMHFPQWHQKDLEAMILRDRNHPSVILWSIGNEIDYPNDPYCHPLFQSMTGNNDANKPAAERMYNPSRPNAERLAVLAAQLADEVRQIDTTHPVTLAAAFPELSSHIGFLDALDVAGYNYKEHLYEESHQRFPQLPFLGSENGHTYAAWRAVTDNNYISGQFLWTGIDYLGEAHGWPVRASGAGLLTLAGFEKSGYYRRMSFWSSKPMVHLSTARFPEAEEGWYQMNDLWNYLPGEQIRVCCYTNLPEAELFLNNKSLGEKSRLPEEECITWDIIYEPGTLSVLASDTQTSVTHCLHTVYAPCQILLQPYQPENSVPDIIQIDVSVLDHQNHLAVTDSSMLHAEVSGGTLLGMENGDIADCTPYTSQDRRVYQGHLILYIRPDDSANELSVTVTGDFLAPASVTLKPSHL